MGAVYVKVKLLGLEKGLPASRTLEAMVDTGATLSIFPSKLLRRLGVKPLEKVRTRLADGRIVQRSVGEVKLQLNGHTRTTQALFGHPKDATVIGVVTLESMGLTVDPIRKRLVHADFLML